MLARHPWTFKAESIGRQLGIPAGWDSPHGRLVALIQYAAAAALRKPPPEVDNKVVDLT